MNVKCRDFGTLRWPMMTSRRSAVNTLLKGNLNFSNVWPKREGPAGGRGGKTKTTIAGLPRLASAAQTVILTGDDRRLENTADQPTRVAPVAGTRDGIAPEFMHLFPAYSCTIMDLKAGQ